MTNKKVIGIYKYRSCNINSLISALNQISIEYFVSDNFYDFHKFDKVIFPGVGNMNNFKSNNLIIDMSNQIKGFIQNGGMIYGICLGLQLLLEFNEEAKINTLGFIKGKCITLQKEFKTNLNVGFKNLEYNKTNSNEVEKLFDEIDINSKFYFLHKYYCKVDDKNVEIIHSKLEDKYLPSLFIHNRIIGTQFHPELSKTSGLKLLKNFCEKI